MKTSRHILADILGSRLTAASEKKLARETAAYLIAERRTGELDSLLRDIEQYRADHGTVEVVAVSAFSLDAKVRKDIETEIRRAYPAAKHVMITERRDENQVAGVRLELANQQLDLTVRAKLNRFKQLTAAN